MRNLLPLLVLLYACSSGSGNSQQQVLVKSDQHKARTNAKIRNNINVQGNGVQVEQAFLTYADGTLVSDDNVTNINKELKLNLVIDGWEAKDGRVLLGASEKVTTSEGEVLMNEPDLFNNVKNGFLLKDARYIQLSLTVPALNELADHYTVEFKVWSPYTQQFVYGSYQFFIG